MDQYLAQLLEDLAKAEEQLRHAISERYNPFANNGEQWLIDSQANVDRLHELITTHLNTSNPTNG